MSMRITEDQYRELWKAQIDRNPPADHLRSGGSASSRANIQYVNPTISERNHKILNLFNEGYAPHQISERLRITRNVVFGVLDRARKYEDLNSVHGRLVVEDTAPPELLQLISIEEVESGFYYFIYDTQRIRITETEHCVTKAILAREGKFCPVADMIDLYFVNGRKTHRPMAAMRNGVSSLRGKILQFELYIAVRVGVGYKFVRK